MKNWMTFNEPRVVAALGYDNGFFAPGRCSKAYGNCTAGNSATEPYIVSHNLILSHAAAVQRYREKYQVSSHFLTILSSIFTISPELIFNHKGKGENERDIRIGHILTTCTSIPGKTEGQNWNSVGFCLVRTSYKIKGRQLCSSKGKGFSYWMVINNFHTRFFTEAKLVQPLI